ncbi:Glycophorin-C [Microtus ochrogaster]|uniref:Glycophorin-C n=1 Tax=Microtus ochrogaster TaxID=79684 RepID=A0A8J6G934_MICOH|nr:Glycophorin-C [Microtus ochrogaster]
MPRGQSHNATLPLSALIDLHPVFLAAVITAVALVLVCLLFLMLRYLYRYKGTYHTNEAKGTEFAESADAALQSDPALQDAGDNSKKEYFI